MGNDDLHELPSHRALSQNVREMCANLCTVEILRGERARIYDASFVGARRSLTPALSPEERENGILSSSIRTRSSSPDTA